MLVAALVADAQFTHPVGADLHDYRLDIDLAARHIELRNDGLQRAVVLRRGAHHQRVGGRIRSHVHGLLKFGAGTAGRGERSDAAPPPPNEPLARSRSLHRPSRPCRRMPPPKPPPKPLEPKPPPSSPNPAAPETTATPPVPSPPNPMPLPRPSEPRPVCGESSPGSATAAQQSVEHRYHLQRLGVFKIVNVDARGGAGTVDIELCNQDP